MASVSSAGAKGSIGPVSPGLVSLGPAGPGGGLDRGPGRQGRTQEIDQAGPRGGIGRTKGDAPEIDGKVHITSRRPLRQGDIVTVKIERSDAYDLYGTAG